jgi:hypothetical protein
MITKLFEIRDRMTFIPVLAVRLLPHLEADRFLLARAGYGLTYAEQNQYVLLCQINGGGGSAFADPNRWPNGSRTYVVAHAYIIENFDLLQSGAVIDVEFILRETTEPKQSERLEPGHSDVD